MKSKVLAVVLASAFVVTSFSGCGKDKSNEGSSTTASTQQTTTTQAASPYGNTGGLKLPVTDKPVTLSAIVDTQATDINNKIGAKELEKRTGVTLDLQIFPASTILEKIRMRVASGDLPDLVTGLGKADVNKLGAEGAVAPINKYFSQLPNLNNVVLKDNPWVMKSLTADDNNLYFWPTYNIQRDVNHGFMYRKDIFDKNGIKAWNNTEEFYQALKKLKEIYPDSAPWTSKYKEKIFYEISYGWGIGSHGYPAYYDESAKTWKSAITSPEWKDIVTFMKKIYDEGLLDKEFLTTTAADFQAKLTDGRSFVTFDWIGRFSLHQNLVKDKIPEYDLRYANPIGSKGTIRTLDKVGYSGTAIKNNDKKEVAMKFFDYLTSESGSELYTVGIKDVTFKKDAKGVVTWPDFPADKALSFNDMTDKFGIHIMGIYTRVHPDSVYFKYTPAEQEAQDMMVKNKKFTPTDPILKFTEAENEVVTELTLQLQKKAEEFSAKYVVDKTYGEKQWNDYVAEVEKIGINKLVDVYNAAQKRYDAQK